MQASLSPSDGGEERGSLFWEALAKACAAACAWPPPDAVAEAKAWAAALPPDAIDWARASLVAVDATTTAAE